MSIEIVIEISAIILSIVSLFVFVPRNKIRDASLIFLFKQTLTWALGLLVAQYRLIEYPVRLLSNATKASITFEYFAYPVLCVIFNLSFPKGKGFIKRQRHYFAFCSGITLTEVLLEKYTELINYINWSWYWTWISLYLTFFLSRKFYGWFYRFSDNS